MKGRELLIYCLQRVLIDLKEQGKSIPQVGSHAIDKLLCNIAFKLGGEALEYYLKATNATIRLVYSIAVCSI